MQFKNRKSKKTSPRPYTLVASGSSGFTLLLAALVSSIVLSIGAAIFAIALKQVTLASAGKSSQFAFYAADTAAECALFWDVRNQAFATSSNSSGLSSITCDTSTPIPVTANSLSDSATSNFSYAPNGYCAKVSVTKTRDPITNGIKTVIHADGYSTTVTSAAACDASIAGDVNALQRSVELHY